MEAEMVGIILGIILSSSVLVSIITSYITIKVKNTDIKAKYIIEERKDWRNIIRTKAVEFEDEIDPRKKEKIMHEIQLRLNPNSEQDNEIIKSMKNLCDIAKTETAKVETNKANFMEQIAELLKEDWERAKVEVKTGVGNFYKCVYLAFMTITYNFYLRWYLNSSGVQVNTTNIINIILLFFMLMYMFKFIKNIVKNNSDKLNKIIQKIRYVIGGTIAGGTIAGGTIAGGTIIGGIIGVIVGVIIGGIVGVIVGVIIGGIIGGIIGAREGGKFKITMIVFIIFIGLTIGWWMIYIVNVCQYMNTNDIIRINCSISISVLFFALINVFKDISTEHWYRK